MLYDNYICSHYTALYILITFFDDNILYKNIKDSIICLISLIHFHNNANGL